MSYTETEENLKQWQEEQFAKNHEEYAIQEITRILKEIATEPKGAWNNDPLTYTKNVVHWCMDKAQEALNLLQSFDTTARESDAR